MNQERETIVRTAIGSILDELNGGNPREVGAVINDQLLYTHRTLQQCFWSAILHAQILYSDSYHDLRNEASVRLARLVREAAQRENLDLGLPYI